MVSRQGVSGFKASGMTESLKHDLETSILQLGSTRGPRELSFFGVESPGREQPLKAQTPHPRRGVLGPGAAASQGSVHSCFF